MTAYGGSWADDDIDLASISVPIEKNSSYRNSGPAYGSNGFGSSRGNQSTYVDNGPPYIVKIVNIPPNSDASFLDDLFKSRFTKYVKGRIFIDPSTDPLRTGTIKKIAFVELNSFADQNRVLKWQDLIYRGSRRIMIELADFGDFQDSMSFNQNHERELEEVERNFNGGRHHRIDEPIPRHRHEGRGTGGGIPLDSIPTPPPRYQLHTRRLSQEAPQKPLIPAAPKIQSKPKPNPFGLAKPVDIVAHQLENEKKMIMINHTTIKTLGSLSEETPKPPAPKEPVVTSTQSGVTKTYTAAPLPEPIYGKKQSLARLLSSTNDNHSSNSSIKAVREKSPPPAAKPTILKKKPLEPKPVVQENAVTIELDGKNSNGGRETTVAISDNAPESIRDESVHDSDKTESKGDGPMRASDSKKGKPRRGSQKYEKNEFKGRERQRQSASGPKSTAKEKGETQTHENAIVPEKSDESIEHPKPNRRRASESNGERNGPKSQTSRSRRSSLKDGDRPRKPFNERRRSLTQESPHTKESTQEDKGEHEVVSKDLEVNSSEGSESVAPARKNRQSQGSSNHENPKGEYTSRGKGPRKSFSKHKPSVKDTAPSSEGNKSLDGGSSEPFRPDVKSAESPNKQPKHEGNGNDARGNDGRGSDGRGRGNGRGRGIGRGRGRGRGGFKRTEVANPGKGSKTD